MFLLFIFSSDSIVVFAADYSKIEHEAFTFTMKLGLLFQIMKDFSISEGSIFVEFATAVVVPCRVGTSIQCPYCFLRTLVFKEFWVPAKSRILLWLVLGDVRDAIVYLFNQFL